MKFVTEVSELPNDKTYSCILIDPCPPGVASRGTLYGVAMFFGGCGHNGVTCGAQDKGGCDCGAQSTQGEVAIPVAQVSCVVDLTLLYPSEQASRYRLLLVWVKTRWLNTMDAAHKDQDVPIYDNAHDIFCSRKECQKEARRSGA